MVVVAVLVADIAVDVVDATFGIKASTAMRTTFHDGAIVVTVPANQRLQIVIQSR